MKKTLKAILLITIVLATICGCKWKSKAQEQREAIENEFSTWLNEHYTEYKIKSVKTVQDADIIIPYDTYFYRITVKANGKNIVFIYNSKNKDVWSNEYWQTVNNDYQNIVMNTLGIPKGAKQDINITSKISSTKQSDMQVLPYGITKLDDIKDAKNKLNRNTV